MPFHAAWPLGAGAQQTLEGSTVFPLDLEAGSWSLSRALPDPAPSLATNARSGRWAKIMRDRFGARDPRSMMLRTHAQTG
ncbi:MAG: methylmalonyl-CoA mutase family protein [Myxococcaceae bacterium]|nr:methylmalonyl-CoA mutase family protein [Myxococcaceae bacterium]